MSFSGPMFEPTSSDTWESSHKKEGAHYNIFHIPRRAVDSMPSIKTILPTPDIVNELNFVLFGTSGIHGSYGSVEDLRESFNLFGLRDWPEDEIPDGYTDTITFLIVHPRLVAMRYGNVKIKSEDDLIYLEGLRDKSKEAVMGFLK